MQDVVKTRVLLFLAGLIFVPVVTVLVIMFAKGWRPNFQTKEFFTTGLLVAHSYPEGAQIFIDGQLKSATNTTINLPPGLYTIDIKKAGFHTWSKSLLVEAEIVTRATATLFPTVPTLKQITSQGAALPVLSPDGTKVVYTSLDTTSIYLLDLNESPLGLINRESKLLANLSFPTTQIQWSPDSRQILAITPTASASATLIDISTQQSQTVSANNPTLKANWEKIASNRDSQKFSALPERLQNILATSSAYLDWSPRENKLMFTATASATLPPELKRPLPGSSSQPENRILIPGSVYVYDIEEDRNFQIAKVDLISPPPTPKLPKLTPTPKSQVTTNPINAGLHWLPTSSHLISIESGKIIVTEYDGQNPTEVYTGPMASDVAIPYPSAKQMLILADLSSTPTPDKPSVPNLYALTLR